MARSIALPYICVVYPCSNDPGRKIEQPAQEGGERLKTGGTGTRKTIES